MIDHVHRLLVEGNSTSIVEGSLAHGSSRRNLLIEDGSTIELLLIYHRDI